MMSSSTCTVCGGPIRADARYGVCRRTIECRQEWGRRRRAANAQKIVEQSRKYCAAHRPTIAQRNRKYYAANRQRVLDRARANREKVAARALTADD